jgi:DNA helicase-2/ATP-dependent DNA helicase PcrA
LARVREVDDLGAAAKKKLESFRELLDGLRVAARTSTPSALLEQVLASTGYLRALEGEDTAESDARIENLRELVGSVQDYEAEAQAAGEEATLAGLLERVTLVSDVDGLEDAGRVVLMTVHGAKGLEFERVVLTGMEEEMFPYKGVDPGERDELEEERRLAYVAITRARQHLTMTHTQMRQIFGKTRWNRPSRFLGELPQGVAEYAVTAAAAGGAQQPSYVDRESAFEPTMRPWRHPQGAKPSAPEPGARFVDPDFFDDRATDVSDMALRRGSRVAHQRFGEGKVTRVISVGEPAVVAVFPGWGEKKILARFLKPAE